MNQEEAVKDVEQLIMNHWGAGKDETSRVELIVWGTSEFGLRIAEVSLTQQVGSGTAGGSFMQVDPEGLLVCALAERCVLERMDPELGDQAIYDQHLIDAVWGTD